MALDGNDLLREEGPGALRKRLDAAKPYNPRAQEPEQRYVDNRRDADAKAAAMRDRRIIKPRAFTFRDPKTIPPRPFIMGGHYIRRYVGATIAPPGLGKSALVTVEAIALASGRRLLGLAPRTPKRVWYLGEDDQDELDRRFLAVMKFYGVSREECEGRLFVESFRDTKLVIAEERNGVTVANVTDIEAVIAGIRTDAVDVFIADPLVKTHRAREGDNGAMEAVYTAWGEIAERGNCAVELVVHTRKGIAGQTRTIEDARGASSQIGVVRDGRLLVRMTSEEAQTMGIDPTKARLHVRIGDTKENMAPPPESANWLVLKSISLENVSTDPAADNQKADNVQVVAEFKPPSLFEGVPWERLDLVMRAIGEKPRRAREQAKDWVGHLIGDLLEIETVEKSVGRKRVKRMIDAWIRSGALEEVNLEDENREKRPFVKLGNWDFSRRGEKEET